jgi:hypothetical protein
VGDVYDCDLVLWANEQAHAIRAAGKSATNMSIDWENVAAEIASLGANLRRELPDRIAKAMKLASMRARRAMADYGETPLVDLDSLTFSEDQVLGDWLPSDPRGS